MGVYRPATERLIERLRLDPATHCVEWIGPTQKDGYGTMNGGLDCPGETLAHRIAYLVWNGPIPAGLEVDHRCNNRRCCNPQHLQAITHAANVKSADYTVNHRNGRKTHCLRGHEFTEENTIHEVWLGKPRRKCRTCANELQRRRPITIIKA